MAPSSHRSEAERRRLVMLAARVLSPLSNEPPVSGRIEAKDTFIFFPSLFGEGRESGWRVVSTAWAYNTDVHTRHRSRECLDSG